MRKCEGEQFIQLLHRYGCMKLVTDGDKFIFIGQDGLNQVPLTGQQVVRLARELINLTVGARKDGYDLEN